MNIELIMGFFFFSLAKQTFYIQYASVTKDENMNVTGKISCGVSKKNFELIKLICDVPNTSINYIFFKSVVPVWYQWAVNSNN